MTSGPGARHLSDDLQAVRSHLLDMCALTEDLVRMAVEALGERDLEKARKVIVADQEVDALELELDEMCINLLALHQPVARDLRFIAMAMRISNDIERIGDHAVNLAEATVHLDRQPHPGGLRQLEDMARIARQMLANALDAFTRGDAQLARDVCRRDDQVDALLDAIFRVLLTHMMEEPRRIGPGMSLILASRNLERIADLATNIAEDVVYMVEGQTIKHAGPDAI
jgi:phosphate transport system protein